MKSERILFKILNEKYDKEIQKHKEGIKKYEGLKKSKIKGIKFRNTLERILFLIQGKSDEISFEARFYSERAVKEPLSREDEFLKEIEFVEYRSIYAKTEEVDSWSPQGPFESEEPKKIDGALEYSVKAPAYEFLKKYVGMYREVKND